MKFRYNKYGPGVLRPVIPIDLTIDDRAITYEALVDSGADYCIFPAEIGELLGLDITHGIKKEVAGITGQLEPYYVHPVTLTIGGWSYAIQAGFLPNIGRFGYGVLGQYGLFDRFIVQFDLLKKEIELKPRMRYALGK
jgi:hypothetical protein